MIHMLIVDDERLDRQGVAYLIGKYAFPIETSMADSVEEALQILDSRPVDILFTDICMPEKNGLELIRLARQRHPTLECIIYSAFGEFEYAKKAMQYGVRHYILKPLKLEEFQATMREVLEDCRRAGRQRQEEQLLRLLLLGQLPQEKLEVTGRPVLVDLSLPLFADKPEQIERLTQEMFRPLLCVSLNEFQIVLLTEKGGLPGAAQTFCRRVEEETGAMVTVVLGAAADSPEELLSCYTRMEARLDAKFFSRESGVLDIAGDADAATGDYQQQVQEVEACIRRGEKMRAIAETELLFQTLEHSGALSPMYVKYLCSNLVHLCTESSRADAQIVSDYINRLFQCPNIYQLRDVLLDILGEAMPDEEGDRSTIEQILQIVEQEYMKDISLEQIADRVQLSPSYLSFYFKKETGRNFIKYLTVFRLEKAKELLRTTDIKVITISEMVGYLNSSYFCLLFKNYTGLTPARFREEASC